MLFSAWQAMTQALQPMQELRSIAIAQAFRLYSIGRIERLRPAPAVRAKSGFCVNSSSVAGAHHVLGFDHLVVLGGGEAVALSWVGRRSSPVNCQGDVSGRTRKASNPTFLPTRPATLRPKPKGRVTQSGA